MVPKTQGKDVELFVIQTVYKREKIKGKNEFGITVIQERDKFVKEAWARVWMDKNDIGPYGEYAGSKGDILKARTLVYNKSSQTYYKVGHSLNELRQVMQYSNVHIGYKRIPNEV